MNEKLSIVIPNYNGADLLASCLSSISAQTYVDYSVTVVDNGSDDNSVEVARQFGDRVSVVRLDGNEGFGRAVNKGIESSDGGLVFVLNNDTVLARDCLAEIVAGVSSHYGYGFFAPKICEYDHPERVYAAGLMLSRRGYGNRSQRFLLQPSTEPVEVFGACGAGAVYRREVLDKVGLFNEDFLFLYEDLELSYRHQLLGHKCLYLPSATLFHRGSATLRRFFRLAVREAVKNSLMTLLTCTPAPLIKRDALAIVKFYLSFWGVMARKGFTPELLRGILFVALRIREVLKRRIDLQSRSRLDIEYLSELLYDGKIYVNFPDEVVEL